MTQDSRIRQDWQDSLEKATGALQRSQAAPAWLTLALRAAATVAVDLAPESEAEPSPPKFFYPH